MQQAGFDGRPECRGFRACAVAENRMAELIASMRLAAVSAGPWQQALRPQGLAVLRRGRSLSRTGGAAPAAPASTRGQLALAPALV